MRSPAPKRNNGNEHARVSASGIPKASLERMAQYHQIAMRAGEDGNESLSSVFLARILGVDETLVRKDMASVSIPGKPRVGYATGQIIDTLEEIFGLSQHTDAVMVDVVGDLERPAGDEGCRLGLGVGINPDACGTGGDGDADSGIAQAVVDQQIVDDVAIEPGITVNDHTEF